MNKLHAKEEKNNNRNCVFKYMKNYETNNDNKQVRYDKR